MNRHVTLAASFSGAILGWTLAYWSLMLWMFSRGPAGSDLSLLFYSGVAFAVVWWACLVLPVLFNPGIRLSRLLRNPLTSGVVGGVYALLPGWLFLSLFWFFPFPYATARELIWPTTAPFLVGAGAALSTTLAARQPWGRTMGGSNRFTLIALWLCGPVLGIVGTLCAWALAAAAGLVDTSRHWV
jgi:hypothetical protein